MKHIKTTFPPDLEDWQIKLIVDDLRLVVAHVTDYRLGKTGMCRFEDKIDVRMNLIPDTGLES